MEKMIYDIAHDIHQGYVNRVIPHNGYGIWRMAGDFLNQLIVPSNNHPLAYKLMRATVDYYCDQYKAVNR